MPLDRWIEIHRERMRKGKRPDEKDERKGKDGWVIGGETSGWRDEGNGRRRDMRERADGGHLR